MVIGVQEVFVLSRALETERVFLFSPHLFQDLKYTQIC